MMKHLIKFFKNLEYLLGKHFMEVNFIKERDNRFKYNFITKDLFNHETFITIPE